MLKKIEISLDVRGRSLVCTRVDILKEIFLKLFLYIEARCNQLIESDCLRYKEE